MHTLLSQNEASEINMNVSPIKTSFLLIKLKTLQDDSNSFDSNSPYTLLYFSRPTARFSTPSGRTTEVLFPHYAKV